MPTSSLPFPAPQPLKAPPVDPHQNGASAWFFKKYWWITVPVVLAIGGRILERKRKNTLTAYNVLEDISTIAAPGIGVLGVIALIRQEHSDALIAADERESAEGMSAQSVKGYYQ